eukprot:Seg857.4 transcript_id=Seg857.4/GoldUCD/mRNA.D3Y31 product="Cyclic AMP receptor-like protein A" protein_id=Seg857.4/GoldUCD/D3Y31
MTFANYSLPCPLFPDHPTRCNTVLAVKRTSASLSLIGCVFLIFIIWLFQKYKFFDQRMILFLGVAALLDSVSYIMGDIYPEGKLCDAQAFLMSYFDWAVLCWVCCITFNLWLLAIKKMNKIEFEKWYHIVCWGVPLLWAALPFVGDHYGPAGVWCWVDNKSYAWRFGIWYIPLFILIFGMAIVNSYIVWKVYSRAGEWEGTFSQEHETDMKLLKEEVKTLLAYPVIYLILNICPLIYRIHNAMHRNELANYPLLVLMVMSGPLQGACNAIAFAMDRETFRRLNWTEVKLALRSRSRSGTSHVIHNYQVDDAMPDTPGQSPNYSSTSSPSESPTHGEIMPVV